MKKLPHTFYRRTDVLLVAKELLGKVLVTNFSNYETAGRIVEVEAYAGINDKASHAFAGLRTGRNNIMYDNGGFAYVYLCYGIHHLFNVVTAMKDIPHAVLVRGVEPLRGMEKMAERTGKRPTDQSLTRGPGNLSKALGIMVAHSGISLRSTEMYIADDGIHFDERVIKASPRIGVEYAGKDAKLPFRFYIKGNPYVSGNSR
jgi:DNA-3-methyladenine glycosylase